MCQTARHHSVGGGAAAGGGGGCPFSLNGAQSQGAVSFDEAAFEAVDMDLVAADIKTLLTDSKPEWYVTALRPSLGMWWLPAWGPVPFTWHVVVCLHGRMSYIVYQDGCIHVLTTNNNKRHLPSTWTIDSPTFHIAYYCYYYYFVIIINSL